MAGAKKLSGRMGMTKAMKRAARLSSMHSNRKRDKQSQRSHYHSEFKRAPGKRGYPRLKGRAAPTAGFVRGG